MSGVKLFFAGDFCAKPSTSIIQVSDGLRDLIQSCDLKVVNFEVPLRPNIELPYQKFERFWQHDDVPDFLRGIGFNLFPIATNHTFDWGEEGYKKTKTILGDQAFGAGTYDEAYRVKVCEVGGVKIGFLALCYAAYTGVFDDVMHHEGLGCAYVNDLKVNHIIIEAKKRVDFLFILSHDGIEYYDIPMPDTIARYRDFVDYGADGVIGCHPHCPQGWEEYKGKPIFYSLGNFFFNSKNDPSYRAWNRPHWYEGLGVVMELSGGDIQYHVVNTRNNGNVEILLDKEEERNLHNKEVCNYLVDQKKYHDYLMMMCREMGMKGIMPIIDRTIHPETMKFCTKKMLRAWLTRFRGKNIADDFDLKTLLRNDTRRELLFRSIEID